MGKLANLFQFKQDFKCLCLQVFWFRELYYVYKMYYRKVSLKVHFKHEL